MDELTAALAGSFQLSTDFNSIAAAHPRYSQYKVKTSKSTQEDRRHQILELQKQNRFDGVNYLRCLADGKWDEYEDEDEVAEADELGEESMEVENIRKLSRPGRYYRNQLMLSEWLLEVPENFERDWLMVPCPVGSRNLVVASRGKTRAYARNGALARTFQSALPGGGAGGVGEPSRTASILDCVYSQANHTYYVLDLMCWKNHPFYDSETEFRFYWLQSKFEEEIVNTQTNQYQAKFQRLRNYECTHEDIATALNDLPGIELDGILFYHKNAHYTFGCNPLVLWLKVYMLPEILGVPVPKTFLDNVPKNYTNFETHVEKVRSRREQDIKKGQRTKVNGNVIREEGNQSMSIKQQEEDQQSTVNALETIITETMQVAPETTTAVETTQDATDDVTVSTPAAMVAITMETEATSH